METLLNDFSPGLFLVSSILLIALILLMVKFAWKPILTALEERETGIQNALDAADQAKKDMESLTANNDALLNEARAEREALLKEARELKDKMISDAKAAAQAEGDKMLQQAQEAIESEKKAAVADIKKQVASLSLAIAEKVIKSELSSDEKQQKMVADALGDMTLN
ncbi:MAG: F0F1 ATP synthase subunit B [Flavobacteriaceae bacterium]